MAIAEPALRQFGFRQLQRMRFRGGNLLGTAIGSAIGIGYGIAKNYDLTFPWSPMVQPGRSRRPFVGDVSQKDAQRYSVNQALRSSNRSSNRFRRNTKSRSRGCSCCTCHC